MRLQFLGTLYDVKKGKFSWKSRTKFHKMDKESLSGINIYNILEGAMAEVVATRLCMSGWNPGYVRDICI